MLLAVPLIISVAASRSAALRSGILVLAISSACALVSVATFVLLGSPDAESRPAAFFNSTAAGGVLQIKENEWSAYTVITTGIIIPG